MQKLLIFPFNGNGLEALDCLGNNYELIGFIDDDKEKQGKNKLGFEVFSREALLKYKDAQVLAVPGNPNNFHLRANIISALNITENRFTTVIHPSAVVSLNASIGVNVLIMAGVVITSNAKIEDHICVLPNTVIHHDTLIEQYTLIGSNITISGNTTIGKNCYIGSGSNIINNIRIGNNTLIGMGSNVIKSIADNSKAVGNPARLL